MQKLIIACLLVCLTTSFAEVFRASDQSLDEKRGILFSNQKVGDHQYLVLTNIKDKTSKQVEIDGKTSSPTILGDVVVICCYGTAKIVGFDYELKQRFEMATPTGVAPFYSSSSSDGQFLYVYAVQFTNDRGPVEKFVYKYFYANGKLTFVASSKVGYVGKIVTYKQSVFVINENNCEKVRFDKP